MVAMMLMAWLCSLPDVLMQLEDGLLARSITRNIIKQAIYSGWRGKRGSFILWE